MANHVAIQLDRRGLAEMSCIAGVGGDVPHLLKIAQSGRHIIALDGCVLACAKNCLARHEIDADSHHLLNEYGVKKRYHADFDPVEAENIIAQVTSEIEAMRAPTSEPTGQADEDAAK